MKAAIEVQQLRKRYGDVEAVDGVGFEVMQGEVFGLLGPNGAGKTTTVECLLGLRQPDGGTVRLLGMEHGHDSRALKARLGAQLQTTGFLKRLTVKEQLRLYADLFPRSLPVDEVLDKVGLREKANAATGKLSGGQRQRLALAIALINDPDIIFLDEPTTGLDPQARRSLWDIVRQVQAAGKTVLLTTHYMDEAEQLCDRVAIMDHGQIIGLDSPAGLIGRYFQDTAIEFVPIGASSRDLLAGLPAIRQTMPQNGHVTLFSTDVPQTMAGLFGLVSSGQMSFKDLTVRQATLEDLFLKLTGRRIRE